MLADTTPILGVLDARFPLRRLFPPGPLGVLVHIVEEVLDEWIARTMVHYRWHYDENTRAVVAELSGREVSLAEAREYPLAQWGLRACRATGTESTTQQAAAESEYLGLLDALDLQLQSTAFAMGARPSAVDTILIGSLRGHTNRDPIPDLSSRTRILQWEAAAARFDGARGTWADFPESTPFAQHLLKLARDCYRPFILGNAQALARGAKAFTADTYGESVSYLCRAYPERSRQMIRQRIANELEPVERELVANWLESIGLADCFLR
jgi:glutathione S-transferase